MTCPDAEAISLAIGDARRNLVEHIDVFESVDSTNTWLMQQPPPSAGRFRITMAGQQTSGRGRRGRTWLSPPSAGLYLSVAWSTASSMDRLHGATLVIGACVSVALDEIGAVGTELKWPNDIMLNDGKLGGILTESRVTPVRTTCVVTGIGINLDMSEASVDVPVSDLAGVLSPTPLIEDLAGTIAAAVIDGFLKIEQGDTDAYFDRWMARDWLKGKSVVVDGDGASLRGVCSGVDDSGALLLDSGSELHRVVAGSVQLSPSGGGAG